MNLPNIITLSRIPAMVVIVWMMQVKWHWAASIAFVLFVLCAFGDWLDGYIARRQKIVSLFGKFMDALSDKIFVLGIMIAFVEEQVLSIYWILPVLCREFLVSGMRMMAAAKGVVISAERGGKTKTFVQLISMGGLLLAAVMSQDFPSLQLNLFGLAWPQLTQFLFWLSWSLFVFSVLLTVQSGVTYIVKYRKMIFAEDNI